MHKVHVAIEKMHQYPIGTNIQYLTEPDSFPNLLDLDPIERTFIGENKAYWRGAAKANLKQLSLTKSSLKSSEQYWAEQEEPLLKHQLEYRERLNKEIETHRYCFREANKRRKTGFGVNTKINKETLPITIFYRKLWAFITHTQENVGFKNHIVERALNVIRENHYFEETHDEGFGVDNHAFLKRILADLKCSMECPFDIMMFTHKTVKVAKELKRYSQGQYETPTFKDPLDG